MSADLLAVENVRAGYGDAVVLDDISLQVPEHGSLAVLGRNGVGKSTLLLTIMGCTEVRRGQVLWRGENITGMQPHRRARRGIGWVAQEREIFPSLTVEENLTVASRTGRWNLRAVYDLFPRLAERRGNMGNQLSGGEQQMLAVARTLMTNPALLLLDEPLEGLAPIIVEELLRALGSVIREEGMAAIVVEQKARKILGFTDRAIILDRGCVVFSGDSRALADDPGRLVMHLGVAERQRGVTAGQEEQRLSMRPSKEE
jgi:branched-chain amino acid transport system ATP-binding protein